MGKDCGSWLYQQFFPGHSPDLNFASIPPNLSQQNVHPMALHPMLKLDPTESKNWFYQFPYQKTCDSYLKLVEKGVFSRSPHTQVPSLGLADIEQKFLVFDQTGKRISLFLSSVWPQNQCAANPNPFHIKGFPPNQLIREESPGSVRKLNWCVMDQTDISSGGREESEHHEDTEELNALLYSDDDYKKEEDEEEASTGHSPFNIKSGLENKEVVHDSAEIANFATPTKKRRLNEDCHGPDFMDTASSGNNLRNQLFTREDDAQSSCNKGSGSPRQLCEVPSAYCNKRARREKIREMVDVLRTIIPGGKSVDDVADVLDEAIRYLKSLKLKSKALGVVVSWSNIDVCIRRNM